MRLAKLTNSFTTTEWLGEEYHYNDDDLNQFEKDEVVEVLKEAEPFFDLKLFVIYSPRLNESTVVHEGLLEFIEK